MSSAKLTKGGHFRKSAYPKIILNTGHLAIKPKCVTGSNRKPKNDWNLTDKTIV